jgi:hypothetical protein
VAATLTQAVEGVDRQQITLFPECLEDWICEDNPVRVIDVFVGGLDLPELHFGRIDPEATGRPHAAQKKATALHGFASSGDEPAEAPATSTVAWTNR